MSIREESEYIGSFRININNKKYTVYVHDFKITKDEYNSKYKDKFEARVKNILVNEEKIKKQVYGLYKNNYEKYEEDLKNDYIDGFEIVDLSMNNMGVFFSNINQLFTIVNKSNIISKKDTYVV